MLNKQTMRVSQPYSNKIVKMERSITSYVDGEYYKEFFREQPDNQDFKSYPVKVVALRIEWIFSDYGQMFL